MKLPGSHSAQLYLVGGAVRDILMGRDPKDRDWVVIGSSPEEMVALGFSQVGKDFPVFLHPETREEYALARIERKVGVGYHGFETAFDGSVTLEQDLQRRDLTINSMAMDTETGEVTDPYGGRADLADRMLRHTSDAFAEDPVRVLRTARLAARYGFDVADETMDLMERVAPELNSVAAERIWSEIEKGLAERDPAQMLVVLEDCGALDTAACCYLDGFDEDALSDIAIASVPLKLRIALAVASAGADWAPLDSDLYRDRRLPTDAIRLIEAYTATWKSIAGYEWLDPRQRVALLTRLRALTIGSTAQLSDCVDLLRLKAHPKTLALGEAIAELYADLPALWAVDCAAIAASRPADVKAAIEDARAAAIAQRAK